MATMDTNLTHPGLTHGGEGAAPARPEREREPQDGASELDLKRERARRRARLRVLRRLLTLALALGIVAAGVYAFRPRPVPVDVARVARGNLAVEVRESGMTRVHDRYLVSAPVSGHLLRVALEPNDAVSEGQALFEIAPLSVPLLDERSRAEAEARLAAARSALKRAQVEEARAETARQLAQSELSRAEKLLAERLTTSQDADQRRFEAELRREEWKSAGFAAKVAAEEVRLARAALDRHRDPDGQAPLTVRAPVSGQVLRVQRDSAGVVAAGTVLMELGDLSGLEVVADLLTTDAVRIQPGTPASIEGWGQERPLSGRVRKVELGGFTRLSALGVDEQRTNVIIDLSEPRERWSQLGDGYRVEVRVVLWESADVVKLPQAAVFRRGEEWAAFRIDDALARLVPVELGHRSETEVEILSGLSPGDRVALAPGDRVEDGARVVAR